MIIWTNRQFKGHYPVGVSAIVAAPTRKRAAELLNAELAKAGLEESAYPEQFHRFDGNKARAMILNDGNY